MFKILCLTTGSEIRWPKYWTKYHLLVKLVPKNIQEEMISPVTDTGEIMYFSTEEGASWFVRRRLSYNEKRTDITKLHFMNNVFEASDIGTQEYTKKHMFEIIEC